MEDHSMPATLATLDCCPKLEPCQTCDELDVRYRVPFRRTIRVQDQPQTVTVMVTLHFRFKRCTGPLSLGDLLYSTTLLPGEQVRLFTSDRHSRFTFDSSSQLSYRHHNTSEESFYTAGMAHAMSDLNIVENENRSSSYSESSVSGGGSAGIDLGIVEIGGGVSGSSFDASSTSTLARSLSRHAESSSRHVEVGVRAASSTSVGEVSRRDHAQGQSDDHFESASRTFKNPNKCHAVTGHGWTTGPRRAGSHAGVRVSGRRADLGRRPKGGLGGRGQGAHRREAHRQGWRRDRGRAPALWVDAPCGAAHAGRVGPRVPGPVRDLRTGAGQGDGAGPRAQAPRERALEAPHRAPGSGTGIPVLPGGGCRTAGLTAWR